MDSSLLIQLLVIFGFLSPIISSGMTKIMKIFKPRHFWGRRTFRFSATILISFFLFSLALALSESSIERWNFSLVWPERVPAVIGCIVEAIKYFALANEFSPFVEGIGDLTFNFIFSSFALRETARILASVFYIAAPVAGGALLFDLITSIIPKFKLDLASFRVWREIYYFSELNEKSLALAESFINKSKKKLKPIVVFTDVYVDDEYEKSMELVLSAKNIGGICVRDDLLHIKIRAYRKKIFLLDEIEDNNLYTLVMLTENRKARFLKKADIYYIARSNAMADLGENIRKKTEAELKDDAPYIIAVNPHRNLTRNLLKDVPLFSVLEGREEDDKTINLTILGAGNIGTEMFLSAYWYGQIYGYELCINMISCEPEKDFIDKINFINPDIFDTCVRVKGKKPSEEIDRLFSIGDEFGGRTSRFSELMKVYEDGEDLSKPYFKFRYYQTNITDDDLEIKLSEKLWADDFKMIDSDYFMVSIGNDHDNLVVADKIRMFTSLYHMEEKNKNCVLTYVIYDSAMAEALNDGREGFENGVYMHAIGGIEDVFDKDNICMIKNDKEIQDIKDVYSRLANDAVKTHYKSSQYDYWANIARVFFLSYKIFSAKHIKPSLFEGKSENELEMYIEAIKSDKELAKKLAWIEHRRWNAFMRINGYRCPKDFMVYAKKTGIHKNLDLKLHPCIVECAEERMDYCVDFESKDTNGFDCLDMLVYNVYKGIGAKKDFKKYDFPEYDFLETASGLKEYNKGDKNE